VAILYCGDIFPDYGGIFACRHCYGLAYRCQQENSFLRALRRMDKICERLGGDTTGIIPSLQYGKKPKGMHWRTYERLSDQYDTLVDMLGR